jgi:Ca2+:H+ antiporter
MPRWLYALLFFTVVTAIIELVHIPLPPLLVFVLAALGIIPLAALIGVAVERIAEHTGERIGGLLFATFGNATELIIGIFSLRDGLVEVVRASIIGSILGNALLVLGISTFIGSARFGRLSFPARPASQYASLFALCVGGLTLPTFAELLASHNGQPQAQIYQQGIWLSDFIAVLLLLGYLASLLFSVFRVGDKSGDSEGDEFDPLLGEWSASAITRLLAYRHHISKSGRQNKTGVLKVIDNTVATIIDHEASHAEQTGVAENAASVAAANPSAVAASAQTAENEKGSEAAAQGNEPAAPVSVPRNLAGAQIAPAVSQQKEQEKDGHKPALLPAIGLLIVATVAVGWMSDILVSTIEPLTTALHWKAAFVGLVFVPLIGGLPEYFNTISMALNKRMEMVLAASAGSSIQIALLMAPILVLVSLAMSVRLDFVFSVVELAVLGLATFLFSEITRDGELVWLEGLLLILLYAMMAGTVFLFGA